MSLPMITFSLRPFRSSILPSIAASVSTRVVSWNDAADSHESVAGHALHTVGDAGEEVRAARDRVLLLRTVVGDDRDDPLALLVLAEPHDARRGGHHRRALGRAGLEELDDSGQAVRDVLTGDAAGV